MTNKTNKTFGLAPLKIEGELQHYETGRIATAEERTAYEQRQAQQLQAMQKFEHNMHEFAGDLVTRSWILNQLAIIEMLHSHNARVATSYLKDMVLYHIAEGKISDPSACAKEIADERPDPFSWGWW